MNPWVTPQKGCQIQWLGIYIWTGFFKGLFRSTGINGKQVQTARSAYGLIMAQCSHLNGKHHGILQCLTGKRYHRDCSPSPPPSFPPHFCSSPLDTPSWSNSHPSCLNFGELLPTTLMFYITQKQLDHASEAFSCAEATVQTPSEESPLCQHTWRAAKNPAAAISTHLLSPPSCSHSLP